MPPAVPDTRGKYNRGSAGARVVCPLIFPKSTQDWRPAEGTDKTGQRTQEHFWKGKGQMARADHNSQKRTFEKLKKTLYATQSVCGICGRPVDFSKVFPDPWSATADHIIPVSKGGAPASLENLQLAHLQCNRIKAARLMKETEHPHKVKNNDLPLSLDWVKWANDNIS